MKKIEKKKPKQMRCKNWMKKKKKRKKERKKKRKVECCCTNIFDQNASDFCVSINFLS